jgi:hypothetical protein
VRASSMPILLDIFHVAAGVISMSSFENGHKRNRDRVSKTAQSVEQNMKD